MRKNLKKQLSDDAKIARVETWALKLGLDPKDTSAALTEKYGPYAYDVMCAVMMKPVVAAKQAGGQVKNSKEAAAYFRIGENKLRKIISENKDADFVLWNGTRSQIKRKKFENYIDKLNSL